MGKIVKTTDFVGEYAIQQNIYATSDLQAFIDKYEIEYLRDLFGPVFAALFYADISTPYAQPVNADYAALFNPIQTDEIRSEGIKEMLLGFIYWEYCRKDSVKKTLTGHVTAQNEVSSQVDAINTQLYLLYNKAVKTYVMIAKYIDLNEATYGALNIRYTCKALNHWAI